MFAYRLTSLYHEGYSEAAKEVFLPNKDLYMKGTLTMFSMRFPLKIDLNKYISMSCVHLSA